MQITLTTSSPNSSHGVWRRGGESNLHLHTTTSRPESEKHQFCDKLACEWDLQNEKEFVLGLGDLNRHFREQNAAWKVGMEEME